VKGEPGLRRGGTCPLAAAAVSTIAVLIGAAPVRADLAPPRR
jgi:hypothetical protein